MSRILGVHFTIIIGYCLPSFAAVEINGVAVVKGDAVYNQIANNIAIVDEMIATGDVLSFASIGHLNAHTNVRSSIIGAMTAMNAGGINWDYSSGGNYTFPLDFVSAAPDTPYFGAYYLSASIAINRLETSTIRTECQTACDGAILIGHRRTLGDLYVDNQIGTGNVVVDGTRSFVASTADAKLVTGDWFYLRNHPDYEKNAKIYLAKKAKEQGINVVTLRWYGENFLYIGGRKASGLGMDSYTIAQARTRLASAYKEDTGITLSQAQIDANIGVTNRERIAIHAN